MGEYAEQYALEVDGVDISMPDKKRKVKWACPLCGRNLFSELSQRQHMTDKHKKKQPITTKSPESDIEELRRTT